MSKDNFITTYCELGYLKEDLFQWEYKEFILDVWYYWNWYLKLRIIKDCDWENPLEMVSFLDAELIEPFIEIFRKKLEDWFYDWEYIVNEWYEKEL